MCVCVKECETYLLVLRINTFLPPTKLGHLPSILYLFPDGQCVLRAAGGNASLRRDDGRGDTRSAVPDAAAAGETNDESPLLQHGRHYYTADVDLFSIFESDLRCYLDPSLTRPSPSSTVSCKSEGAGHRVCY